MPKRLLEPYWESGNVTLYQGDCLDVLGRMPSASVHCCVTSPPYFGLRSYIPAGSMRLKPGLTPKQVAYVMAQLAMAGVILDSVD